MNVLDLVDAKDDVNVLVILQDFVKNMVLLNLTNIKNNDLLKMETYDHALGVVRSVFSVVSD